MKEDTSELTLGTLKPPEVKGSISVYKTQIRKPLYL
jgi:hypothetical protein